MPRTFVRRSIGATVDLALATTLAALVSTVVATALRGPPLSWLLTELNLLALFLASVACVLPTLVFAYLWHRFATAPGLWLFGLTLLRPASRSSVTSLAAVARWILLFAPIAFWVYPLVVRIVFDPSPFLILIEFPAWLYAAMVLPVVWYPLLGASVLAGRDGRGWHDRICGSMVVLSTPAADIGGRL